MFFIQTIYVVSDVCIRLTIHNYFPIRVPSPGDHQHRRQIWGTCAGLILLADKVIDNTLSNGHGPGQGSRPDLETSQKHDIDAPRLVSSYVLLDNQTVDRNKVGCGRIVCRTVT